MIEDGFDLSLSRTGIQPDGPADRCTGAGPEGQGYSHHIIRCRRQDGTIQVEVRKVLQTPFSGRGHADFVLLHWPDRRAREPKGCSEWDFRLH
ncbi:hypothetical protein [Gluconobacter potus]|uniref:hypothetical protein n=1 Tax=Gluconobacter potus TaxID=2724927 RepID=UPI0012DA8785|nr:hypothetical protein [Gluconobacter potus]